MMPRLLIPRLAAVVCFILCAAALQPAVAPSAPPDKAWRELPAPEQQRLERVYRQAKQRAPHTDWSSYRRLREERGRSGHFERFPAHWRDFLVRNARWAREHVKQLPAAQQQRLEQLPLSKRANALKKILRPHFLAHLKSCRRAAREVFSPLELKLLKQLPPRKRVAVLRRSRRDAFGLISPWSSQKYQALGQRKALVDDYLLLPEGLTGRRRTGRPAGATGK